jgi:hypothetical protein
MRGAAVFSAAAARFWRSFFWTKRPVAFRLQGIIYVVVVVRPQGRHLLLLGAGLGIPAAVSAQTNYYTTNGTEYAIIGSLPGDQVFPDVAVNSNGGFVVWQDNITDGSGWGMSAARLDSALVRRLEHLVQPVNAQGANDQENPRVAC